ncbi:MAG: formate dehydrogenase accessory sulfurtransferase FdhD [Thermodesulfovibrionales bacterium]|nr:formate dehydrogenase accessory sulfurtransferase FdhD [Thermodesulfovibrionales bacterium]
MERDNGTFEGAVKQAITKVSGRHREIVEDAVAVEKRLRVSVNGKEALTMYCTPLMIRELIVGFFMTEGIIRGRWCTEDISISSRNGEIAADITAEGEADLSGGAVTSGCAGGLSFAERKKAAPVDDPFRIDATRLRELYMRFQAVSGLHKLTGCVHSAAMADASDIICFAEDIGRHNAVDKVIGYCLLEGMDFRGRMLLTSGRVSSEVASKCARWGIPLIASRAAPTDMAIDIAGGNKITVVGFLRGGRFNIYTGPERVL